MHNNKLTKTPIETKITFIQIALFSINVWPDHRVSEEEPLFRLKSKMFFFPKVTVLFDLKGIG